MEYTVKGGDIEVKEKDFDLDDTLDCGQAFRWKKIASDCDCTYEGYFSDKRLVISRTGEENFIFHNTSERDFLDIWVKYFDFETDYSVIKHILSRDKTLAKACDFAGGMRLLRQDAWECVISFIISQNNNIPRIKGIIERLCGHYGGRFPDPRELSAESEDSLAYLKSGFRAKYIIDAAKKVSDGDIDLEAVSEMPIGDARAELRTIKGVGPKVAECILLYGMHRTEAFPVDVWIKRVLEKYYPDGFPEFAEEYAGIAQQYLFHYIRHMPEEHTI